MKWRKLESSKAQVIKEKDRCRKLIEKHDELVDREREKN